MYIFIKNIIHYIYFIKKVLLRKIMGNILQYPHYKCLI